jgi:nucleoside-diphosphate kinase
VDYGDVFTKTRFDTKRQRTFAMIKPDVYTQTGKVLDAIYKAGFTVSKLKMSRFNQQKVDSFYGEHIGKPFYGTLSSFVTSDVVTGLEIVAEDAIAKWRNVIGPTNSLTAKQNAPRSIRA